MSRPSAFSVYASHFLNATNALNKSFAAPSETTEPLFFSVTEGSHLGDDESPRDDKHDNESDVGDDGFPRLVGSELFGIPEDDDDSDGDQFHGRNGASTLNVAGPSTSTTRALKPPDDPYLDDTDIEDALNSTQDIPLIRSPSPSSPRQQKRQHTQGWLAHFSHSRNHSPLNPMSPELSSPSSSPRSSSSEPPDYLLGRAPTPPPTRTTLSESLLPRDGVSRILFTLPDQSRIPRRKYNDYAWTAIWCTGLLFCGVGSILVLFVTTAPSKKPSRDKQPTPYFTITHAIPLLTLVTILSSAVSYVHLLLLRLAVRPVLMGTALAVPVALILGAAWSFAGSFIWEDGAENTWGETVGLRIFSIVPLICAFFSARALYNRRHALLRTVSVVELSTTVVLDHPPILLLSLGLLLVAFIASIPFLSLILRLTLIGYYSSDKSYHIAGYAGWLALLATIIWIWSWGIVRGVLKVSVSGVVGSWYFRNTESEFSRPAIEITERAFTRASGPSLGSICVSTLVLTFTQVSIFILRSLQRISTPPQLMFLSSLHPLGVLAGLIAVLETLGSYTLTYIGLTGDKFWESAKQSRALASSGGRGGRLKGSRAGDYSLLSYLLLLSSLSVALFAAVGGYIFAAHTLSGPSNAPLMALLTGGVTFMTVRFGIGVGEDAADALFLCYRMDLNAGARNCKEAFEAFEGNRQPAGEV
ncbi:hypothetical protein FRC02_003559 [Tulasnella sp. 418]|nr:hypothetical protein FRC02_003559 [Tulasnella sp. 418]